ncbi:UV radiation resistance protein, partial [Helicobacter pylori]
MSWIDISVGSGSSGSGSSNNLLSGFINSLGNALSNASASGGVRGFPWQVGNENDQIVGYYDDPQGYYSVIKKFLAEKNYNSNQKLKNAFERITNIQNRINTLNHETTNIQNRINTLNQEISNLNNQINQLNQALDRLNQEIAGLNNEITANESAIKQDEEKLNALELQTNAKKEVLESLKRLEKLKQELKRLKKQSKWKKEFNFLTDNPPNIQANQESALNRASGKNALMNFFLTDPYAILPKGFIYEYHNPGKETYNALNAPNNMDGINNQFKTNALNQVLDNSYQKFLAGNASYNSLGDMEQVKALKFYDLVLNHNPQSENLESALFFKQISQYAKGLRLKILTAPSSQKDLQRLEKLENTLKQEEERLKGKDL